MSEKKKMGFFQKTKNMTDTNLLLAITMIVFFAMYIGAMIFEGKGFLKAQTFLNMLNANAALIIASCGMSIVMITGSIDISVGGVAALVSMWKCSNSNLYFTRYRTFIWSGTGLFGSLFGYPAVYCILGGNVFCTRHDNNCKYRAVQCAE